MTSDRRALLARLPALAAGTAGMFQPAFPARGGPEGSAEGGGAMLRADQGRRIRVGRSPGALPTIAEAARQAGDGDLVEIEAGVYSADTAVWLQRRLAIRAVGGPVRLPAQGRAAEGKAIWVLRNGEFDIEGVEFSGCSVPARNGAGIRFERGRLRLDRCRFIDNDTGVLTGNDAGAALDVHRCEFSSNGAGDGYSHGLYAGAIAHLRVVASYFSRARGGHLLKSRAARSLVLYNRLTDEPGGSASYEADFPNGGFVVLMGNLVVQEAGARNHTLVAFGAEGYRQPRSELVVVHNTLVNRHPGDARFVRLTLPAGAGAGAAAGSSVAVDAPRGVLRNNVFVGRGRLDNVEDEVAFGNVRANERAFRAPHDYDFAPVRIPALRDDAEPLAPLHGQPLVPDAQYRHPMRLEALAARVPRYPGAFQD